MTEQPFKPTQNMVIVFGRNGQPMGQKPSEPKDDFAGNTVEGECIEVDTPVMLLQNQ